MSILDKLLSGFKTQKDNNNSENIEKLRAKLKVMLYDDELVDELTPIFSKLENTEGFDKVMDLLESKEAQINTLAKEGYWAGKQSDNQDDTNDEDDNDDDNDDIVASIINAKYSKGE